MNAGTSLTHQNALTEGLASTPAALVMELRMETFCLAFLPDFASAADVIDSVLKDGIHSGNPTHLYRRTAAALMHRSDFELPVPGDALSANMAWQLREAAGLTHEQIADVLQTSVQEVERRLWEVQSTLHARSADWQ